HPLLGDREERLGDGEPHDAQEGDPRPVAGRHPAAPGPRHEDQREEPEPQPAERDEAGLHRLQPFGDQQERRAPDQRGEGDEAPVDGGERGGARALGGRRESTVALEDLVVHPRATSMNVSLATTLAPAAVTSRRISASLVTTTTGRAASVAATSERMTSSAITPAGEYRTRESRRARVWLPGTSA